MIRYHDEEWGVPQHDSGALWELLTLEGFQAGLSWITVLRKREAFRKAFRGFDPAKVARFGEKDIARLLAVADQQPPARQDRGDDQRCADLSGDAEGEGGFREDDLVDGGRQADSESRTRCGAHAALH